MKPPVLRGPMAWAGSASSGEQLDRLFPHRSIAHPARAFSVGILSTYPSAQDSVATFAASLAEAFVAATPQMSVHIVRLLSAQHPLPDQDDVLEPPPGVAVGTVEAAGELNRFDVVIVQHEYGIQSHADAEQLLDLLELLRVPVVLVVRTMPAEPTAHQRHVLEILAMSADAVVAMSQPAHRRLLDEYRVEPERLVIIPQGAATSDRVAGATWRTGRPTVLTWGLLAPGKGIEWGIDALAAMSLLRPRPKYVVIGRTHPALAAQEAAKYRQFLAQRAVDRGVAHLVEFEPAFVSPQRLGVLLRQADVVLVPYDSRDQVTSGVLTQALAAMLPVVSTSFPHAVELLGHGQGGTLVPHEDPAAIAAALTRIIVEPGVAAAMSVHNSVFASLMSWPTVADRYRLLLDTVTRRHSTPSR